MSLNAEIPDQFIDIEGLRIRYIEHGAGRPLLMLHGMGFWLSADQFLPHFDAFGRFAHVYALDLPGWGLSEPAKEGPYFPLWLKIIAGFCDAMGFEELDVFGYSIGGWASALFAAEQPLRVRRLIMLDSPGMNLEAPNFVANFRMPTRESLKEDMVLHMREMVSEAMVDEVYARLTRPGHEDAYRAVAGYVATPEVRKKNSLHSVFPKLTMPLLLTQMDNATAVMIRYHFEAYQLAPNARMFIYYGGNRRTVGGIVPEVEAVATEFLTADEISQTTRK